MQSSGTDGPGRVSILLAVVQKELRDILRNRTLLVSLLAPVVLAVLFVKIVERTQSTAVVRIAMLSGSDAQMRNSLSFCEVHDVATTEEARKRVELGSVDVALLLPSDFNERLGSASPPSVSLVVRRDAGPRSAVAVTVLTELLRARAGQQFPVSLSVDAIGGDSLRGRTLVGFVVFVLLMGFGLVAISLVEERERGTLQAIRVTGASPGAVLLGKALTMWVVCLLAALAMIALCGLLRAPFGGLLAVMVVGAGFAVSLGLWMGVVFPNVAAANAGLPVVFLVLFVPAFMEEQLQWTWTAFMPGHWLMQGIQRTLVEGGGQSVWWSTIVMGAYAVACATAAWVTLRMARS